MAKLVDNPKLAFRLARAIVSDIALYNQEKVKELKSAIEKQKQLTCWMDLKEVSVYPLLIQCGCVRSISLLACAIFLYADGSRRSPGG